MQELLSIWSSQSPDQMMAKASQHAPIWVSLLLVLLIAYYLAKATWLVLPSGNETLWTPPPPPAGGILQSNNQGSSDFAAISDAHLFGTASANAEVVEVVETEDAPDTQLNLKLRAAVAADDDEVAHAIIADGSGDEKVYFIKSLVPGGAKLHRVHIDRVILNRGGVLETLRLPRETESQPRSANNRTTQRSATRVSAQQVMSNNAATFAEIIRPQPFMPNGQLKGYRVFPGRNRQQFISLGLRPGDLVTEINGVALNNPTQGMEIFRSLGESSQVSVTIERAGQTQTLNLDANTLAGIGGNKQ